MGENLFIELYGLALATDYLLLSDTTYEDCGTLRGLLSKTGFGSTAFTPDTVLLLRSGSGWLEQQLPILADRQG